VWGVGGFSPPPLPSRSSAIQVHFVIEAASQFG
jgi:hypothetical protein